MTDNPISPTVRVFDRLIAFFLLVSFTLLNIPYEAYAESLRASPASRHGVTERTPSEILDSLSLPEELGTIEAVHAPPSPEVPERLVIHIQAAPPSPRLPF